MTVQTTYSIGHAVQFAGMVFTQQPWNGISKLNKGASVIPFGKGLVTDGENGAKLPLPGSVAAEFNGVAMYEINRAQADGDVAGGVPNQDMTVVPFGGIWVIAHTAIAKDEPAHLVVGSNGPGDWANVVGAGNDVAVAIANAKFLTAAAAPGDFVLLSMGIGG